VRTRLAITRLSLYRRTPRAAPAKSTSVARWLLQQVGAVLIADLRSNSRKIISSECLRGMALLMLIWLAMIKRRAVRGVQCHLPITRDDIVVNFQDAASIHVRCWPVNTRNGSTPQSVAPPILTSKASTSARDPLRRSCNGPAFRRFLSSAPPAGDLG
jgi:hypothetical protein